MRVKKLLLVLAGVAALALTLTMMNARAGEKMTICHVATGSGNTMTLSVGVASNHLNNHILDCMDPCPESPSGPTPCDP